MLVSQEATCLTDVVQQAYQQLMRVMLLIPFEDGIHVPAQYITVSVHYIINAVGVKQLVSSHTPWTGAYRRVGKPAYGDMERSETYGSLISAWSSPLAYGSQPDVHVAVEGHSLVITTNNHVIGRLNNRRLI